VVQAARPTPGDPPGRGPAIVLIGPMGVGKSTVGALLAQRIGRGFRDTDDDVVAAEGRPISDIFVDEGEPYFREIERQAVHTALAEHHGVLALGGGAVLDASTRARLAGRPVVYLSMDVDEAVKRTGLNVARPLLAVRPRRQWRELMEQRHPLYTEVARAVVATDQRTPDQVAEAVLDALEMKQG
jgi:shikimate kinase